MREIKFRAWDGENMLSYISVKDLLFCYNTEYGRPKDRWDSWNFDMNDGTDPILMQYTGLKDKNGKEIYEGDVVKVHTSENEYTKQPDAYDEYGVVQFGRLRLEIEDKKHGRFIGWKDDIEVIGNIHENPELLSKS